MLFKLSGELSVVQRRIYIPMDEPREEAVLSFKTTPAEADAISDDLEKGTERLTGDNGEVHFRHDLDHQDGDWSRTSPGSIHGSRFCSGFCGADRAPKNC